MAASKENPITGVGTKKDVLFDSHAEAVETAFDPQTGEIRGVPSKKRYLSDLAGFFQDQEAYRRALAAGDPLVYSIASVEPAYGEGQLHFGMGCLMPGKVGNEYYFTLGHYHAWRPASEIYICLSGEGLMLLECENSQESSTAPLRPNSVVYVPGYTAHRTINTGNAPLIYLGIYPADAGHDYGSIAKQNFQNMVVEVEGKPVVLKRNRT